MAQLAVASLIVALGILFGIWIWYRPIRRSYEGTKRNRIAHRSFPELVTLFERFKQFVDAGISQPHFFLYQLKSRGTDFSSIHLPHYPYYAQHFAGNLSEGLKGRNHDLVSLRWFSDSLANLITYYNETFLATPVKQVISIIEKGAEIPPEAPQVPDDLRKGFNTARLRWVRFLQDFEMFTSRVSKELGKYRVKVDGNVHAIDYLNAYQLEPPEELPAPIDF
jgi:hypothetical protein